MFIFLRFKFFFFVCKRKTYIQSVLICLHLLKVCVHYQTKIELAKSRSKKYYSFVYENHDSSNFCDFLFIRYWLRQSFWHPFLIFSFKLDQIIIIGHRIDRFHVLTLFLAILLQWQMKRKRKTLMHRNKHFVVFNGT